MSSRVPYAWMIHSHNAFDWPSRFFGFAALSVDTSTKRLVSNSTAISASAFVARTLLRAASIGFASSSGTCLYAAAWKTTAGRYFSKTCRIFAGLPTSASTGSAAGKPRTSTSSRSISNSAGSELSTRTIRLAPTRATWRQSSAPIEPPAPVMSTV
jgi:hypothetical protein